MRAIRTPAALVGLMGLVGATLLLAAGAEAQVVRGKVLDSRTRQPVSLALLKLIDTTGVVVDLTVSSVEGNFMLQSADPGSFYVSAERLGYKLMVDGILELGSGGLLPVEVLMGVQPIEIEGLVATADRIRTSRYLATQGFYDRMEVGIGRHLTPEKIAERPWFDAAAVIESIPFTYRTDAFGEGAGIVLAARGGGRCAPRIVIDNVPFDGGGLETMLDPDEILAVEVYRGTAQTPPEWSAFNTCGAVLIWTKRGRMAGGGG